MRYKRNNNQPWTRKRVEAREQPWDQFVEQGAEFVFGASPVLAAMKTERRRSIYTLYVQSSLANGVLVELSP